MKRDEGWTKRRVVAGRSLSRRASQWAVWASVPLLLSSITAGSALAQNNYNPPPPPPRRSAADATRALFAAPGRDAAVMARAVAAYAGADGVGNDGPLGKLDPNLVVLFEENSVGRLSGAGARSSVELATLDGSSVVVDAFAATPEDAKALLGELTALGLSRGAQAGRVVSGFMPVSALDEAAALANLHSMALSVMMRSEGASVTQGDKAMMTDDARLIQGIDGTGVKVGVISDSFDHLGGAAAGVLSGDLPAVQVVGDSNLATDTDEGRAMCEIVMDVAPGASQAFHTANGGQANMVNAINQLIGVNCHIIVDDIRYLSEPMYQDGIIAQAASNVFVGGRLHFSAAGNQAARSYENGFNNSVSNFTGLLGGKMHAWDGNDDVYWQFDLPNNARLQLAFQWDDPHFAVSGAPGAQTDMGIAIVNSVPAILASSNAANIGGNPSEIVSYTNTTGGAQTVWVTVERMSGPPPVRMKWVRFSSGPAPTLNEYSALENKSTVFGTPNGTNTVAVAAAFWNSTPEFGTDPAAAESFTSLGGTPIRYNLAGAFVNPPTVRNKPEITAPDGGNTTFFGQDSAADADADPNFFGTSAAAPHAAAFAALVYHFHGGVTKKNNAEVRSIVLASAVDMNTPGFDFLTGAGLIQAFPDALDDKDGVDGVIENEVPSWPFSEYQPMLDGNGDNLPDRAQSHVASFPNAENAQFITLIVPPNVQISDVDAYANPPVGAPPANETFPVGTYAFRLSGPGVAPGGITQANVLYEVAPNPLPTSYWKIDTNTNIYTRLPAGGPGTPGVSYDNNRQAILWLQDGVGATNIYDLDPAAGVIYDPGGPSAGPVLAVDLTSFTATRTATGVDVAWTTASELDTAGFNLWRGTLNNRGVRVNSTLIPAEGSPATGGSYTFADDGAPAEAIAYWLEEIDLDGTPAIHGPATVDAAGQDASSVGQWMLY